MRRLLIRKVRGLFSLVFTRRVHNRFGGMRDLAIFCGDTRDASSKQGWEAEILIASGSRISYFYELGMWET